MNILDDVMTLQEAAYEWSLDDSTLRHAIKNNKFNKNETKKSASTWLILKSAMIRVYGTKNEPIKIFTKGYEGESFESFIETLKNNNINYLFDVREIPLSRKQGFSKSALSAGLENNHIKYFHFKELGSPKEIRHKLHNDHDYSTFFNEYEKYLETQIATLDILNSAIYSHKDLRFCLLCFEKDPLICHRSVIAKKILNSISYPVKIINI